MNQTDLEKEIEALHEKSFHWALSCCHWNYQEAEDVIQICYVKVLDGRARFNEQSSFKTWFFAVIHNTAKEHYRKHRLKNSGLLKLMQFGAETEVRDSQEALLERAEQKSLIKTLLSQIPKRQRQTLELVFYQDMTIEDAALILGIGLGSARTHYDRGKKKLLELMSNEHT